MKPIRPFNIQMDEPVHSKNFFVGFQYPMTRSNHAGIFFRGEAFANTWQLSADWVPGKAGWWTLNRDGKATEMKLPVWEPKATLKEMLDSLEHWLAETIQEN